MSRARTRRPTSARDEAEALFKPAAPKAAAPIDKRPAIPGAKELVSLRIDRDVLEHFQNAGPGWQDLINNALRAAAGMAPRPDSLPPDEPNSSNVG
ncbi:BrnA antitoxin family protein [Bosea sp. TAF32]|uniref:BrnA antitoxin family protein n=1 Tax=Bosea sp. TAF32 TaxID=3237482 RepID=UPI003F8F1335